MLRRANGSVRLLSSSNLTTKQSTNGYPGECGKIVACRKVLDVQRGFQKALDAH